MKPLDRILLIVVGAAALVGLGLSFASGPATELERLAAGASDLAAATGAGLPPERVVALAGGLDAVFGSYAAPQLPPGGMPSATDPDELRRGHRAFALRCAQCHAMNGAADTGAALLLKPRPRSFRLGLIKFTSTAAGEPPARADLERVIRDGIPTTAMAGFPKLPEPARRELATYAEYLLVRGATEQAALARLRETPDAAPAAGDAAAWSAFVAEAYASVRAAWQAAAPAAPPVSAPPDDAASRARGAALFADPRAACTSCHGADGAGRGPASFANGAWLLRDVWGGEARPRDFATGDWFGGDQPEDLYRRIAHGVKGTPMAAYASILEPGEIWDLVHYVRSFAAEAER